MLTLAGSLQVGSFTLFRDVVYRDGVRSFSPLFYALPAAPRLARDADGAPLFDFLWYHTPPGAGGEAPGGGGLVTLTVELAPNEEEKAELAAAVTAALAAEGLAAPEIRSVPFRAGTVDLAFAGETGEGGDFASRVAGSGPAHLAGGQRATFAVDLSRDGATLLAQALAGSHDLHNLLWARYDLVFDHRLDDVELRVWCDARRAQETAAARRAAGPLDPARLRETLIAERTAGVELLAERPLAEDERAALETLGHELLDAALADAFPPAAEGDAPPASGGVELEARLNHTFRQTFPAAQHAVLAGFVRLDGTPEQLAARVRRIDLDGGFFRIMEVQVHCLADFAAGPIETVWVRLDYDATGPTGRVRRSGELVFRAGAPPAQSFRTDLATPDQRAFRYEVEVFYAGNAEPTRIAYPATEGTAIVLDLDRLGVLRVEAGLRDVPLERVRAAVLELEYPPLGLSHTLILDGERPAGVWQAVVREAPGEYAYRVSWLTADGRRLESERQTTRRPTLALDAPASLLETASVRLVAAGDFAGLAQIVVDLETPTETDTGGEVYSAQYAFTKAGETKVWEPPVADRAGFRYRVRFTFVDAGGGVRALDWQEDDRPVLVVRDVLRFEVAVVPRLLDLGGALAMALLALEHRDEAAGLHETTTLVLRDREAEARWAFRLAAPDRHTYRYQLTLIPKQGPRTVTPWQEAEAGVLVLPRAAG